MSTTQSTYRITLRISDIASSGSVSAAIISSCESSDYLASGVIGPSFSTSGPGSGWQRQHDATDYASRALDDDYGARGYVDAGDGRLATLDDDGEVEWSEESIVAARIPDSDEVDEYPDAARAMLEAVESGLICGQIENWADVAALLSVSVEDALGQIEGGIHGDNVIYYDDSTRKWYANDATDLTSLRILMGSPDEEISRYAYSHWCSQCPHNGEFSSREEAVEASL